MGKVCSIFGHRNVFNQTVVRQQLYDCLVLQIVKGVCEFYVGVHGDFDSLSLDVLGSLKKKYESIEVNVVFTSLHSLVQTEDRPSRVEMYSKYNTVFFEVEKEHFKNRITKTNQLMIDKSDVVVVYVDESKTQSGAKNSLKYARKKNKEIINLY